MKTDTVKNVFIRLFSAMLALCLIAGLVPPVHAEEAGVIRIRTAQELSDFAKECVSDAFSEGFTVSLENDIDLSGSDFEPIPLFGGHFLGNGHTVFGLELDGKYGTAGFFRMVLASAVIEDLNIEGRLEPSDETAICGGIAAENCGTITNCAFTGTVCGVDCVGGIVGCNHTEGIVEHCKVFGSVSGQHRVGGVAGENDGTIRYCANSCKVNTEIIAEPRSTEFDTNELLAKLNDLRLSAEEFVDITDIGGIAGRCSGVVRECTNFGEIGHTNIGYNIGGIVGHLSGYTENCENRGSVRGRKDVGGVVGQIDPYTEWNVSGAKITALREKLGALQDSIARLADDAGAQSSGLSADLTELFAAVSEAETALDTLSENAISFVNANIDTLNLMSGRVQDAIDALAPAASELSDFTEQLPAVFDRLSDALDALHDASALLDGDYTALTQELQNIRTELENIRGEIAELLEKLQTYANDPQNIDIGELLNDVMASIRNIRESFTRINTSIGNILNVLAGLGDAGEPLNDALIALRDAAEMTARALESLDRAQQLISDALDSFAGQDALTFTPINDDPDARRAFFHALGDANSALTRISAGIGSGALSSDVREVSDSLFDLIYFCIEALEGVGTIREGDIIEDVSARTNRRTNGTVNACTNSGIIAAETNTGGIVGAISLDFEFDLEDQFNLSALLSGGAKYVVYSGIFDSVNNGCITARKSCAGGVVGRMDYGVASGCGSSGSIEAGTDYAGGIAGLSDGTLADCMVRVTVGSANYAGGIAGSAHNVINCLALTEFSGTADFRGCIAGDADGAVENNFYADSAVGGVNGFSYTGCSELIEYAELLNKSGAAPILSTVRVEYYREGELLSTVLLPYGGGIDSLPDVPDRDGRHWRWDDFDQSVLRSDLRIDGCYLSPVYVLASDESEKPLFLIEGSFEEGQRIEEADYSPDLDSVKVKKGRILSAKTLRVDGYSDDLIVHLNTDKDGVLYTTDGSGKLRKTDYTRDGSYIVFRLENGGSYVYIRPRTAYIPYIIGGAAAVLLIGLCVFCIVRRHKKCKEDKAP